MRTMIGKRIGPVPIALVAVLALAAFISAGLWLVPNGNQIAEAQGFADSAPKDNVCLPLGNDTATAPLVPPATTPAHTTPVAHQCVVSGDSATIRFTGETAAQTYQVFTDGKITEGADKKFYFDGMIPTGKTASDEPTSTISYKEVKVPAVTAVSPDAKSEITISRNGKNPIKVHVINGDATDDRLGINAAVGSEDYELKAADQDETIYFVTTRLGRASADMSDLKIADVGDTTGVKVDTKEGESGIITANFMDYQRVVSVGGYQNVAAGDRNTAGELSYAAGGTAPIDGTLIVMAKATQESSLRAAMIPGMYVTVKNVATIYSVSTTTPPVTTTTMETTTMTGKIATGPGSTAGTVQVTLRDVEFSPMEREDTAVTTLAREHNVSPTPANDEVSTDVMITVHASRMLEDGTVTFTVEGGDAMLSAASGLVKNTTVEATAKQAAAMATGLKVVGLPKNETDPYRAIVKATYSGPTGTHTETNDSLFRLGPLTDVVATACAMDSDNKDKSDGCGAGYKPMNRYSPMTEAQDLNLHLRADDALGSKHGNVVYSVAGATATQWWEALDCMGMNDAVAGYVMDGDPAVGPDDATSPYCKHFADTMRPDGTMRADGDADVLSAEALVVVNRAFASYGDTGDAFDFNNFNPMTDAGMQLDKGMVQIKADPEAGKYALIVTAVKGGATEYSNIVKVVISGKATNYDIMMKGSDDALPAIDEIELNGSRTYILTIADDNGNVPNDIADLEVKIELRGGTDFANASNFLSVEKDGDGNVEIDAKTGTVEFNVYGPLDLATDKSGRIVVSESGSQKATQRVLFKGERSSPPREIENRAPTAVGMIGDITMTMGDMPMTVSVLANFSDADNDALTFSASSSNVGVATVATDSTLGQVTVTAVGVGMSTITVGATDGMHGVVTQTFMVTVEAMADMTLGSPMNLTANPGDGQIMLSWTAGANADKHVVYGIAESVWASGNNSPTVAWSFTDAADSHTVMNLENGTEYRFLVIAGQDNEDGTTTWSSWSNWAMGTPVADTFGGLPPPPGS